MEITKRSSFVNKTIVEDLGLVFAIDDCVKPFLFLEESIDIAKNYLIKKAEKMGGNGIVNFSVMPYEGAHVFVSGEVVVMEDSI